MNAIALFTIILVTSLTDLTSPHLTIRIQDIQHELGGNLVIKVFDKSALNPYGVYVPIQEHHVEVSGKIQVVELKLEEEGDYMVAVLHDINKNGKLDKHSVPSLAEGMGFSYQSNCGNRPSKHSKKNYFTIHEGHTTLTINICYEWQL